MQKEAPNAAVRVPLAAPRRTRKAGLKEWVGLHKGLTIATVVGVTLAATAVAVLVLRMDADVTASARSSPVVFQDGADYASINAAGFATLTLGSSGTSATLAVSGVAGAAQVALGDVLKIANQGTSPYVITLTRSAALPAAVSAFTVTIEDATSTLATWNAKSAASSASFTVPAGTALDVGITLVVADGTAVGALGSFGIQVTMTPA